MSDFYGMYAPIPTPFREDEQIAYDKLEANLVRWSASALDGVVMPGSNSEAAYISEAERVEIWRACAPVLRNGNKRFIAGSGAETTAQTIRLTQVAADLGALATLIIPPFFYKSSMTHEALATHYEAVADASPIPIWVYNVPMFTGIDFTLPTLLQLAEHPRITGIKDSSSNIVKMTELAARRPDFLIFAGTGTALLPFLSVGAAGGIMALANVAAAPLRTLMDAWTAGQVVEARRIQLSVAELNTAITARYGVSGLKYAMDRCGFYGGPARRPLLPLGTAARADIDRILAELELI